MAILEFEFIKCYLPLAIGILLLSITIKESKKQEARSKKII